MEGVDGSGKSTQVQRLADRLRRAGVPVEVSKEPGGTPLCQELRSLLLEPHASGETEDQRQAAERMNRPLGWLRLEQDSR